MFGINNACEHLVVLHEIQLHLYYPTYSKEMIVVPVILMFVLGYVNNL